MSQSQSQQQSQPDERADGEGNADFASVLAPLREPEANWGVDVAQHLDRYATHLGIHLPPEATATPVDFAQAALVVQGSTTVYSRKVEHLYTLAYAAVSSLNNLRDAKKKGKNGRGGDGDDGHGGGDDDDDNLFSVDEVDFLTLDDTAALGGPDRSDNASKINLPAPKHGDKERPASGSLHDPSCLRPVPPMLVQRHSADEASLGVANYKLLTAHAHPSGALLMDGCPPVDENLETVPVRSAFDALYSRAAATSANDGGNGMDMLPGLADNDDDDDDAGFELDFGEDGTIENAPSQPVAADNPVVPDDWTVADDVVAHNLISQTADNGGAPAPALDAAAHDADTDPNDDDDDEPRRDPYALLDPHEETAGMERPLRVGKTYRRPRAPDADAPLWGWGADGLLHNHADSLGLHRLPVAAGVRAYMYTRAARAPARKIMMKRRARLLAAHRRRRRRRDVVRGAAPEAAVVTSEDGGDDGYDSALEVEDMRSAAGGDGPGPGDDVQLLESDELGLDFGDGFDHDGDDRDDDDDLPPPPALDSAPGLAVGDDSGAASLGADGGAIGDDAASHLVDGAHLRTDGGVGGRGVDEGDDEIVRLASSYEEACRQYLEKTAWLWEQKVLDAALMQRVDKWTARIEPVLMDEERRATFDIREYGQRIVDRFRARAAKGVDEDEDEGKTARLSEVVGVTERHEACRMFLASLQLANNCAIDIAQPETCCVTDPVVELLLESGREKVFTTPKAASRTKRRREKGGTPASARRPPLRARSSVGAE